jgi:hypothetical protein
MINLIIPPPEYAVNERIGLSIGKVIKSPIRRRAHTHVARAL